MPRHLLLLLRRAAAGSSRRAAASCGLLHSPAIPPRNVGPLTPRFFSSRSGAARAGGASRSASAAKSLIEDEAELSDWISDLKTDSFHLGLSSGDEASTPRGRASSSASNAKVGRSRDGSSGFSDRRSGSKNSRDSRNSVSRSRFGGDIGSDEDDELGFERPQGKRERGGRGGKMSGFAARRGRMDVDMDDEEEDDSDLDDDDDEEEEEEEEEEDEVSFESSRGRRERGSRGGKTSALSQRGGRRGDFNDDEDDEVGFQSPTGRRERGGRGGKGPVMSQRGGRRGQLDDEGGFGSSRGRWEHGGRGGKASAFGARRGGRDRDAGFGDRQPRGAKMLDIGVSEEDMEGEDEDDELSDFGDDPLGNLNSNGKESVMSAVRKFGSPKTVEGESVTERKTSDGSDSYLSQTRFDKFPLSPLTLKGVKAAGYERMTVVQEATLPLILEGKDVLAKAKTGTGKTVAFLLPAIEVVLKLPPVDRDKRRPINVVVVCPTRELADQAAAEASKLLKFHPSIGVQLIIGGTRLALEQKRMQTNPCQILVATPGRFKDHIENTPGFASRLLGVKVLVLDEADRLLDMGFRADIEKIVAALPKQRQTLLFSATVPDQVRQVCYIAMKRDLEFVNTVQEGSEETHSHVKQMHLVAPMENHFPIVYGLLSDHISENVDYKVIVFCTTAMVTRLVAELLSELKLNVREIHSRKPQSYRTRISKEFKESKGLILVSSDVSARGVDYPNVTLVIQLGVPTDREQYIHRLGRTGRKGKEGSGVLLLAPWEEYFLRSIKDLPITETSVPLIDLDTRRKVEKALAHVGVKDKESAYQAWLGYYNSNKNIGRDKYQLVALANEFSRSMGLNNPPAVSKAVLGKMGLNNIPGLRSK